MREIPSAPGFFADSEGNVWKGDKKLSPTCNPQTGYLQVWLRRGGKHKPVTRTVHRLVCEAYTGPCPKHYQCRHLDGTKLNNRPDNLKWGTYAEQIADRKRHGTLLPSQQSKYAQLNIKLTHSEKLLVEKRAKEMGVSLRSVVLAALGVVAQGTRPGKFARASKEVSAELAVV